jgi:O-antigen/teichoic acid export membrane protein
MFWVRRMPEAGRLASRLIGHVQSPLYGRAYALILSSASTSVLGLLYWTLAARLYSADDVGVNAAVISTMMLLSYLAQLSLAGGLPRFIPTAGRATTRLILAAYSASVLLSAIVAIVFVVGVGVWAPSMRSLLDTPAAAAWFVASTMAWALLISSRGRRAPTRERPGYRRVGRSCRIGMTATG